MPRARLLARVADVLNAFVAKQPLGFLDGHALGVQSDGGEEAAVAQQRLRQLADVGLRIAVAEAHLPHHLFGVVRPALGERVADEQPADERSIAVGVQELQEVAGPHLVHRREQQDRPGRACRRAVRPPSTTDRAARCSRSTAGPSRRARGCRCRRSWRGCTAATRRPAPAPARESSRHRLIGDERLQHRRAARARPRPARPSACCAAIFAMQAAIVAPGA